MKNDDCSGIVSIDQLVTSPGLLGVFAMSDHVRNERERKCVSWSRVSYVTPI